MMFVFIGVIEWEWCDVLVVYLLVFVVVYVLLLMLVEWIVWWLSLLCVRLIVVEFVVDVVCVVLNVGLVVLLCEFGVLVDCWLFWLYVMFVWLLYDVVGQFVYGGVLGWFVDVCVEVLMLFESWLLYEGVLYWLIVLVLIVCVDDSVGVQGVFVSLFLVGFQWLQCVSVRFVRLIFGVCLVMRFVIIFFEFIDMV